MRGTADFSSLSADPASLADADLEEENVTSLYASGGDDAFFNLGGSSFPLLPHAPHMVRDPFEDVDEDDGAAESEQKQRMASASRSSHHFSSVLNNPLSTLSDFEEEDVLPLTVPYVHALTDGAIDTAQLRASADLTGEAEAYTDNHPGVLLLPAPSDAPPGGSPPSLSPTPLSPFTSLPGAFSFARRRLGSSQPGRLRRGPSSQASADRALAKARADEELQATRELADCLSSVPAAFFSPTFDLAAQPFFLSLLRSITFPASSAQSIRAHSAESLSQQSSLSSHLDQVEVNLFRQINARSPLFFSQMERIHQLHDEIGDCLAVIDSMREAVSYVDANLTSGGLRVVELHRHRHNATVLAQRLEAAQSCMKTQHTVQLLLSTGDYSHSLLLIQQTRAVLAGELHGVHAMRHVERRMQEQVRLIEKLLELEMMRSIRQQEDDDHIAHSQEKDDDRTRRTAVEDGAQRRRGDVQAIRRELTEDEKERLTPILENLVKVGPPHQRSAHA